MRERTGTLMTRTISSGLTLLLLLGVEAAAAPPPVPKTPASVEQLVYAAPFTLRQGYQYDWRAERPTVTSGYLVVLRVKPDLVYPRQVAEPVLYVGNGTAERLNVGYPSGHVVAIVPGPVDLARSPMWFGRPALPEQVDAEAIRAERTLATAAGIKPMSGGNVARAVRAPLSLETKSDLLREAESLVETYAPDEAEQARALRRDPN
jgi:hypothetical protein